MTKTPHAPERLVAARAAGRASGMRQFATLLAKDVRREFRTKEMLVSMVLYALLVIIVYGLAVSFAGAPALVLSISGGLLWAMIVFTSLLGLGRSFAQEKENNCLEGLLLVPMDRGVIFLSKATSNLLFLLLVQIIAVPLFWFFFSEAAPNAATAPLIVVPLLLGSVGIAAVGTLLSTITVNTRGKDVMLALLFIPVIFPLLYACVSATTGALLGNEAMESFTVSVGLAAGYDVIMVLVSWLLYQFVVDA